LALAEARRHRGGLATTPADDDTGTIAERQRRICEAAIARIEARG
jgi:hypothetical protein